MSDKVVVFCVLPCWAGLWQTSASWFVPDCSCADCRHTPTVFPSVQVDREQLWSRTAGDKVSHPKQTQTDRNSFIFRKTLCDQKRVRNQEDFNISVRCITKRQKIYRFVDDCCDFRLLTRCWIKPDHDCSSDCSLHGRHRTETRHYWSHRHPDRFWHRFNTLTMLARPLTARLQLHIKSKAEKTPVAQSGSFSFLPS